MAKKFRLLRRHDDGSAVLVADDAEGWAQLFVKPDGSRFVHEVEGICGDCAVGRHAHADCPRRPALGEGTATESPTRIATSSLSDSTTAAPNSAAAQPVQAPVQVAHNAPVVEPEPLAESAPDPADEQLEREAQSVARSVWNRGGRHRNQLFQGRGQMSADAILARAVERGWVRLSEDGIVSPGAVNPVARMPVEPRSRKERAMAWGPGPGRGW